MTIPSLSAFLAVLGSELAVGAPARPNKLEIDFDPHAAPAVVGDLIDVVADREVELDFGAHAVLLEPPLIDVGPATWVLAFDFEEEPWLVLDWSATLRVRVFEDDAEQQSFDGWAPLVEFLRERNGHDSELIARVVERLLPGSSQPGLPAPTGHAEPDLIHSQRERARDAAARGEVAVSPVESVEGVVVSDALTSPDGARRLVIHPVRTRIVEGGEQSVLMEGPWQALAAWLDDSHVVIGTVGGRHVLDRGDSEVATLPALAGVPAYMKQVPIEVPGHLHLLSAAGVLLQSVEIAIDRLATVPEHGLVVASTRSPPRTRVYRWTGHLDEVGSFDVDIGVLGRSGPRWVGSNGFELFGVER